MFLPSRGARIRGILNRDRSIYIWASSYGGAPLWGVPAGVRLWGVRRHWNTLKSPSDLRKCRVAMGRLNMWMGEGLQIPGSAIGRILERHGWGLSNGTTMLPTKPKCLDPTGVN